MPESAPATPTTPAPEAKIEAPQTPPNFREVDGDIESAFRAFEATPSAVFNVPVAEPKAEPKAAAVEDAEEVVEQEEAMAEQPVKADDDGVIQMLKAQNQELMDLVREMAQRGSPAAPTAKAEPTAQQQRAASIAKVKEKLGLTDEEAEAHLSIIEEIADAKARPAIEEAKRMAQKSKEREGQEISARARNEATKIIAEGANSTVYGGVDVPFATLLPSQQKARTDWLRTADALQVGYKQMGIDIDPEKVIRMAHFAVSEDKLAKQSVAADFGNKAAEAQKRRTVSPSDARAAVSNSPKVQKGKIAVDANDDATISSVLDRMLGRNTA